MTNKEAFIQMFGEEIYALGDGLRIEGKSYTEQYQKWLNEPFRRKENRKGDELSAPGGNFDG